MSKPRYTIKGSNGKNDFQKSGDALEQLEAYADTQGAVEYEVRTNDSKHKLVAKWKR